MIRFFDIVFSALGLIILSPVFLVIYVLIRLESKGGGFYVQERIGKDGVPFGLYKFRSMRSGSDKKGLITIGERDERITRLGYFIRRYKLDELPQLWNVLKGDMSMVGPRPEVRKYVEMYNDEQRRVLSVKPGITDYASIEYVNENELLGSASNPDKVYIEQVMPDKINLNMKYIKNQSITEYFKIIFLTFGSIVRLGNINKIANWYFNKKSLPFWCILAIDLFIVFFSYLFVFWFFNGGKETLSVIEYITANILLYLLFYAIGFKFMKTYSGILRYSSFVDLQRIGIASLFGMLCSYLIYVLLDGSYRPLSYVLGRDIVIATILSTLLLWLERIAVKILYDISLASINAKYTFIYGIHEGGVGIAKHIRNEKPMRFLLKGFVSDEKEIENLILMGMHVHPLDEHLIEKMKDEGIEALIVSPLKVNAFRNNEQLQDELIKAGIHIYISQQPQEWNEYDFSRPQLKEISIEDLLPRDEIQVDMESIGKQLADRTVMITGAAGSIGSEMVRQIATLKPKELVLVDQAETPMHDISLMLEKDYPQIKAAVIVTSICNRKRMEDVFCKHRPEYVFHAAAYKHVPIMESNPCESVSNNIFGTKTIADLSVKYQVKKFVMVSTDKAVNPTNVMGCSKRICEIYVQSLDKAIKDGKVAGITQFVTTRFGNVLGSNGSVIPLFEEQIKNGGPVTVTDPNIVRYFMLIPEACKLVLEAGTKGKGGEIFVFDMGKPVKIADLANRMIKLSKAEHVKIQFTGLRPGEKLYEEVLNVEETTKPSFHDKIRIASVREYDYQDVCQHIDSLVLISQQYDDMQTVKKMKEIVPEYKSNNSIFSELDK